MNRRVIMTGNDSAAHALKQVNPDVVAAYPITPQTELMHKFASYVADGEVDTNFVTTESEHSAMSACIGAAASGARVATATCSAGLALMWETLYIAASMRLPIVMPVINRALSAPINIHCDHSDSMGARDAGWIQLFCENCQEVYDNAIQAFRIAEHPDVLLPVMVCLDGFILSHTSEVLEVLDDEAVKSFVGGYEREFSLLDVGHPVTFGPLDLQDYYFEHKRQQVEAMSKALEVILSVAKDFERLSGRRYGFIETSGLEGATMAVIILGSAAGTMKVAIDELREEGVKVGLLKPRVFRPFPSEDLRKALKGVPNVIVFDRSISFGASGGPLFTEVRSSLFGLSNRVSQFVYGLGGRNVDVEEMKAAVKQVIGETSRGEKIETMRFVGLRG